MRKNKRTVDVLGFSHRAAARRHAADHLYQIARRHAADHLYQIMGSAANFAAARWLHPYSKIVVKNRSVTTFDFKKLTWKTATALFDTSFYKENRGLIED